MSEPTLPPSPDASDEGWGEPPGDRSAEADGSDGSDGSTGDGAGRYGSDAAAVRRLRAERPPHHDRG